MEDKSPNLSKGALFSISESIYLEKLKIAFSGSYSVVFLVEVYRTFSAKLNFLISKSRY